MNWVGIDPQTGKQWKPDWVPVDSLDKTGPTYIEFVAGEVKAEEDAVAKAQENVVAKQMVKEKATGKTTNQWYTDYENKKLKKDEPTAKRGGRS